MASISIFKSTTFRPPEVTIIACVPCYLKAVTFRWSLSLCKSQNKRSVSAGLKPQARRVPDNISTSGENFERVQDKMMFMFHYKTQQFISSHCSTAVKVMFISHPVLIPSERSSSQSARYPPNADREGGLANMARNCTVQAKESNVLGSHKATLGKCISESLILAQYSPPQVPKASGSDRDGRRNDRQRRAKIFALNDTNCVA